VKSYKRRTIRIREQAKSGMNRSSRTSSIKQIPGKSIPPLNIINRPHAANSMAIAINRHNKCR